MSIAMVAALLAGLTVAPAGPDQWTVDLSRPISVGSLVDEQSRILVYPPHRLSRPANSFTANLDGPAAVDVRGREPDGDWTEWTEAPAVLAAPTDVVQVRLVLPPSTDPRRLTMRASSAAATPPPRTEAGWTYEIFATREGLVGGRTANGHIIVERDHFVALPSRRGLSMKDSGDYSVKVCARNGRCEWAPVWDVGPWNTKDDHWNPTGVRQMWTDLPQGRPQAQAAKLDGYNGGLDQFGRTVRNPAGIDLADGTFWDGLGLTNNAWVTVTYQWTGSGPAGFVRAGETLNVRTGTTTAAPIVGLAADHAHIRIQCQQAGERITGTQGSTDLWYRLAPDMWVTAAYVSGVTGAPAC